MSKSQINEVYSFGCIPGKMRNQIALNFLTTSQLVGSGRTRYYNDENKERKIQRFSQLWSWLAWRRQGGLAGDTAQRGQGPLSDPHLIVNVLLLDH